jgi:hypothetical protein
MAVEAGPIPNPRTVWVQSTMTEAKIHSLVDRGLLRPKAKVEWKAGGRGVPDRRREGAGRLRLVL